MSLVCSNCRKRAEISATYCRDCYTVFPFEQRQAALHGRRRTTDLSALKWVPAIMLVGGAIWMARSEPTDSSRPEARAATAREDRPTTVAERAAREEPGAARSRTAEAPRRRTYSRWTLLLNEAVDCPAANPCPGELRFAGGAAADVTIQNGDGGAQRLTAANGASEALLQRHAAGMLHVSRRGGGSVSTLAEKRGAAWVGDGAGRANGG